MTIGNKIENLRKKKKISQEKLAELLGISRQTLSNYENDITSPDLNQAKKICEIFDASLDELIGNDNTVSSKISSTERLVKKQTKTIRIILVTLYIIIMTFLIIFTIHYLTKRDFTKDYQAVFTCTNKKEKLMVNIKFESKYLNKEYDDNNFIDERRSSDFTLIAEEYQDGEFSSESIIFAGDSIGEALDSLEKTKKLLLGNGYKCH